MNMLRKFFGDRDSKVIYKLMLGVGLGIIILIMSPSKKNFPSDEKKDKSYEDKLIEVQTDYEKNLEMRLENILSSVAGVGEVKVMITLRYGKEIIVAQDVNSSENTTREYSGDAVTKEITDKKSDTKKIIINDKPLVLKQMEPKVEGIIIIAQGGDDIYVKEALTKSAQTILNVDAHKIQVMKMK